MAIVDRDALNPVTLALALPSLALTAQLAPVFALGVRAIIEAYVKCTSNRFRHRSSASAMSTDDGLRRRRRSGRIPCRSADEWSFNRLPLHREFDCSTARPNRNVTHPKSYPTIPDPSSLFRAYPTLISNY